MAVPLVSGSQRGCDLLRSSAMQAKLTSREAWVRIATGIYSQTELEAEDVAAEADLLLVEYLRRFPDPPGQESAVLTETELQFVSEDSVIDAEPEDEQKEPA